MDAGLASMRGAAMTCHMIHSICRSLLMVALVALSAGCSVEDCREYSPAVCQIHGATLKTDNVPDIYGFVMTTNRYAEAERPFRRTFGAPSGCDR